MRILISGASGAVGKSLSDFLLTGKHEVIHLVRRTACENEIEWDPYSEDNCYSHFEGFDAIIHLSGENIASRKWTAEFKNIIRISRVNTTKCLSQILSNLENPPKVFIVASATGIYGNRGNELLKEDSKMGKGFLAETCAAWEAASSCATSKGIRTVQLRFGTILTPTSGALKKLLTPAKLGILGSLGSGSQYFPWIGIDDVIGAIYHTIHTKILCGPVNCVAPQLVTNKTFTQTLAKVLSRPSFLRIPEMLIRTFFGEMGIETILTSQRVEPERLKATAYKYRHPDLESCLRHMLGAYNK